jgi:ribosomal protein L32
MRGYFGLGQLSATEKQNILDQHKSLYNGYQTMQPQVSNTQPLHVYDFAGDKDGMVVNNKGEVKKYTNMGINEQVEKTEVCDECGAMRMSEGICEQCGSGKMEEATGKLDDIYDESDLNPSAGFDYIEGPSNSVDTFEKMHKNLYKEDEYEDDDNEDDGDENLQVGDQLDEQGYTGGGNAPDMESNIEPAYNFRSNGPDEVYPTEGEMEEQAPEDMMRYKRRGITYPNLLTFIEYEKDQFDACKDFGDEFEYADNVITTALDTFFIETEQELHSDFYYEIHDLCKDWFGEDLITEYLEECGSQEEEEEEDFMFMESAFADEIDEVDVSGSQGIYGEMDPPYDFDSEGPGKAGPYQRTSYNEEEIDEMEVEDEEEFEIDEDLQESFHNQKNKITEMMSRMKIIK